MFKTRIANMLVTVGLLSLIISCTPNANAGRVGELKRAEVGNFAPEVSLENLKGDRVSLSSLRGQPVLLNFWATWCPPCRAEMPALDSISYRYKLKGLVVIGVDVSERRSLITKFLEQTKIGYDIWLEGSGTDRTAEIVSKMEGRGDSYFIPFSVFIDRRGVIFATVEGADVAQLEAQANALTQLPPI